MEDLEQEFKWLVDQLPATPVCELCGYKSYSVRELPIPVLQTGAIRTDWRLRCSKCTPYVFESVIEMSDEEYRVYRAQVNQQIYDACNR